MSVLAWIVLGGVLMTVIALTGSITLLLKESILERIIVPLVAFAAGSLLGGAFFHMLPSAAERIADPVVLYAWTLAGFTVFFALEQILHWGVRPRA